jgi:hypothetical protein
MGICEGKRLLGRPKCKWEDNIKIIFKKKDGRTRSGAL